MAIKHLEHSAINKNVLSIIEKALKARYPRLTSVIHPQKSIVMYVFKSGAGLPGEKAVSTGPFLKRDLEDAGLSVEMKSSKLFSGASYFRLSIRTDPALANPSVWITVDEFYSSIYLNN